MIRRDIDMGFASLWTGEEFECEKTGTKLIKFEPIDSVKHIGAMFTRYKVSDGNREFDVPEEIFNIIKNLMI